jgi:hypothetical protein
MMRDERGRSGYCGSPVGIDPPVDEEPPDARVAVGFEVATHRDPGVPVSRQHPFRLLVPGDGAVGIAPGRRRALLRPLRSLSQVPLERVRPLAYLLQPVVDLSQSPLGRGPAG